MNNEALTNTIQWKLHFRSSPERVYAALSTPKGRQAFWAEKSTQSGTEIGFVFPNGQQSTENILESKAPSRFRITYMGSDVTFLLEPSHDGGTDLILIDVGASVDDHAEVKAGWVSVLMTLKAYVDFGVDLRNHDPKKTWDQGYVDN